MKFLLVLIVAVTLFPSCTNSDISKDKPVDPDAVFYDYKVWCEEGKENVTVLLQYRQGGENAPTKALENGSKVMLDGTDLNVDSARLSGAFYEVQKPAEKFIGKHTIVFIDKTGKMHKEEFEFLPFTLATELPEQIKMEPFVIPLTGFTKATRVRLVMIDTAFATKDVNEELPVNRGQITITPKMWQALKAGPITLEIYREEEQSLKKNSKQDGRLLITYAIKREFEAIENKE